MHLLTLLTFFLLINFSWADNNSLALVGRHWQYQERTEADEKLMSNKGELFGLVLSHDNRVWDGDLLIELEGGVLYGNTQYQGGVQNIVTGEMRPFEKKDSLAIFEAEFLVGPVLETQGESFLAIESGLGWRFLYDINENSDPYSYTRMISYLTLPVRLQYTHSFSTMALGLSYTYHFLLFGQVETMLSEVSSDFQDLKNNLKNGAGQSYKIALDFNKGARSPMQMALNYRRWKFGESSQSVFFEDLATGQQYVGQEPQNDTESISLSFGIYF